MRRKGLSARELRVQVTGAGRNEELMIRPPGTAPVMSLWPTADDYLTHLQVLHNNTE